MSIANDDYAGSASPALVRPAMSLAKRISAARAELGLSQKDLGGKVNAAQSTVASWERGQNEPDIATILRLAKVLKRPPEWLAFNLSAEIGADMILIPEIDVQAVSGAPGLAEVAEGDLDAVRHRYAFPRAEAHALFGTSGDGVVIIEVKGDSMIGTLSPGEKVIVNRMDRVPSPPGIFVLWDGMGLVLKRVEYIPHSDPPKVRILSDNPRYAPYERTVEEAFIQGRVIGSWQRR